MSNSIVVNAKIRLRELVQEFERNGGPFDPEIVKDIKIVCKELSKLTEGLEVGVLKYQDREPSHGGIEIHTSVDKALYSLNMKRGLKNAQVFKAYLHESREW